jgi:hypothetical protein
MEVASLCARVVSGRPFGFTMQTLEIIDWICRALILMLKLMALRSPRMGGPWLTLNEEALIAAYAFGISQAVGKGPFLFRPLKSGRARTTK